jgi:hypothetical protein
VFDEQIGCEITRVFEFVFLLNYLETNGFIGVSSFDRNDRFKILDYINDPELGWVIHKKTSKEETLIQIPVTSHTCITSLASQILKYGLSAYYSTHELKEFVYNDFKSREQINVEEQLSEAKRQTDYARRSVRYAIVAIIMAVLTLLATVILG